MRLALMTATIVMLSACDHPPGGAADSVYVCRAMSYDEGGPKTPTDTLGMRVRNGSEITFSGDAGFDAPASQWTAKMCPNSKWSNASVIYFDNMGCFQGNLGEIPNDKKLHINGSYDNVTRVLAIAFVGNYKCSDQK